ncbi:MAG: hypothetical protein HRT38_00235, partial [Alteromonadaceae bacterium]|nr:hypothetical protein [Alteromonadaceae bacterium]
MKKILLMLLLTFNVGATTIATNYELNLVDKNLNQFIAWFSDTTKKTVILDKDIDGTVTIFARSGVNAKDIYTLFINVLNSQGLTYTIEKNIFRVTKSTIKINPEEIITSFYDFKNISGKHVENLIPPLTTLTEQLITAHYLQEKQSKFKDKNKHFSIEALFSGRSILLTAPRFVHEHLTPVFNQL